MKASLFLTLILLATISMTGNAQFFIEGNLGVSQNSNTNANQSTPTNFSFTMSPRLGYVLNDKISIGPRVLLTQTAYKDMSSLAFPGQTVDRRTFGWELSAFCDYEFFRSGKLSFFTETSLFVGGSSTKDKTGSERKKTQSSRTVGLNMVPLIAYDISDKISLVALCDFLRLDLAFNTVKDEVAGATDEGVYWGFNTQSTFFSALSNVSIGFVYKF